LCLTQQREKGATITEFLLQEKALLFAKNLLKVNPTAQLAQTGQMAEENITDRGSSTSVEKYYRQIRNNF
jgi:hypothetical protein